jgi:integrase
MSKLFALTNRPPPLTRYTPLVHFLPNVLIFPHAAQSVSTAFQRATDELAIEDLRFHDLRHDGASRLFEAGWAIERVALVTGHKDWNMLRRYTQLRAEDFHRPVEPGEKVVPLITERAAS